jgi:NAD(P)-dependent dehydrogenase (short-subunit alcohol dehydrogenase family)
MHTAGASPALLAAIHRSAAATYAASNVRINCVAAGLVEAPASSEFSKDPELGKASAEVRPSMVRCMSNRSCRIVGSSSSL